MAALVVAGHFGKTAGTTAVECEAHLETTNVFIVVGGHSTFETVTRQGRHSVNQVNGAQRGAFAKVQRSITHLEFNITHGPGRARVIQKGLHAGHIFFFQEKGGAQATKSRLGNKHFAERMLGCIKSIAGIFGLTGFQRTEGIFFPGGAVSLGNLILAGSISIGSLGGCHSSFIQECPVQFFQNILQLCVGPHQPEFQSGGFSQEIFGALGVLQTRQLHHNTAGAESRDFRLGNTKFVDTTN